MQNANYIKTLPQAIPPKALPTPAQKLQRARESVRAASRGVQVTEGRLLDFDTAEGIMRALATALREIDELAITVAVLSRKEMRANG
jgi:hypothetical protein